ncbi:MAG: type II secretion system F family protein [FCB group bacterium]|jgi:type IV pilus assembly protein PilC|nr:type II secretion system F family protein [FCB group bacterium]
MPQFRYEVKKGPGRPETGTLEAESRRAAVVHLRDLGYFPISVEEATGEEKTSPVVEALRRVRLKDRNIFFRQLANLIESGMPITRALLTLEEQTENRKMRDVVGRLREDVQKGSTFAEAMERHPKIFNVMQCNLVKAGETGGMLEEVLWRLVTFGEQEEELRGKVVSAMIYPAFLMLVGSAAVFILVSFVFPKFIAIFEDFDANLPMPTQIVMGLCGFMDAWWPVVLLGIVCGIAGLVSYTRTEVGGRQRDTVLLRIPVVRTLVQRYEMAKFARTLGTLLDNGVPILMSLRITRDTLGNRIVAGEVNQIIDRVAEGDSISESLRSETRYFPPMVINMFAVGEESGRLGAVTQRIAQAYDNEVDRAVKALTALFEPLMIVVMGIIIGFLVIAMLLPILTLSSNVG